jgi:hypothetical protein
MYQGMRFISYSLLENNLHLAKLGKIWGLVCWMWSGFLKLYVIIKYVKKKNNGRISKYTDWVNVSLCKCCIAW